MKEQAASGVDFLQLDCAVAGELTCIRRTATPTALSSSIRNKGPFLPAPAGTTASFCLALLLLLLPSWLLVLTSQATNSSRVRTPMMGASCGSAMAAETVAVAVGWFPDVLAGEV